MICHLVGTSDAVASAEKLINEVLAEAEAGASAGGGTRRMAAQSGGDEFSMQIPNNKVGLIIGKGGETIKSMQASTGARIQLTAQTLMSQDLDFPLSNLDPTPIRLRIPVRWIFRESQVLASLPLVVSLVMYLILLNCDCDSSSSSTLLNCVMELQSHHCGGYVAKWSREREVK
ncbi:hypothetical protein KIW84_030112 [Lathyrus oleraceus]|uniref:K Homology domain-containing protein n=1 Tax=Pisum sativum TaxID=3888 RepID=A0A9D4XPH9_PEA|nr:hypothetical protein KIW84_030112 [Pisum sativum]